MTDRFPRNHRVGVSVSGWEQEGVLVCSPTGQLRQQGCMQSWFWSLEVQGLVSLQENLFQVPLSPAYFWFSGNFWYSLACRGIILKLFNFSFFSVTGWGTDLDYCDIEWFALEMNRDLSFWDCIQVLHFRLFCWPWWLLHFFWGIPVHSSWYNGHLS